MAAEATSRLTPDASEEFYAQLIQCLPHLRAFARVLCRQHDLVDDLVQDAVVRVLAASNQFQHGTNFKAWMFTILRNQNITTFRRKRIVPASLDDVCPDVSQAAPQEDALMIEDLDHAVQQLSPLRREALILVVVHGLSYEEAAAVCDCAVGTIKSRVARARAELHDMVLGRDDEARAGTNAGKGRRRRHGKGGESSWLNEKLQMLYGPVLGLPVHDVHFTVYHPKEIKPEGWCTLLAYVHILEMQSTVEADAKQRLEVPHGRRIGKATRGIARGAEIVVIPELPGCRFNPASARLLWLEDWHRVEFRLQAQPDLAGFELGKAVNGRVAFYIESVLVGEVPIWTCISDGADITAADTPASTASAEPYEAIFVSYAHEDSAVVDRLGRAYKVLGMEFLRDVEALRSGEKWNPALLAMIERADIFQLYWSHTAKRSRYVKQEWRHALKQQKSHLIRPLYWQVPMPEPPRELAQLHFSYLKQDS